MKRGIMFSGDQRRTRTSLWEWTENRKVETTSGGIPCVTSLLEPEKTPLANRSRQKKGDGRPGDMVVWARGRVGDPILSKT